MSEEDLKVLLRENLEVSKESLKILKKINRGRVFGNIVSSLKWAIIIGISFGAYYYIEPFLSKSLDAFNGLSTGVEKISKVSNNVNSAVSPDLLEKMQSMLNR